MKDGEGEDLNLFRGWRRLKEKKCRKNSYPKGGFWRKRKEDLSGNG